MSYKIEKLSHGCRFLLEEPFDLARTLESGQCFRWEKTDAGYRGAAGSHAALLMQHDPLSLELIADDDPAFWAEYLDLDRSYRAVDALLRSDPLLAHAIEAAGGLHILRQDAWEALASFILSQNNNIPRIRGIISRFCAHFGEPIAHTLFSFPSPQRIAGLTVEDLAPLRAGFRAKYLLDAARRAADGSLDLQAIARLPTDELRKALMTIYGVGRKVADCTMLYGFGRIEVCPVDVWMKRALSQYEGGVLPASALPYAGIAQQYLFEYTRNRS